MRTFHHMWILIGMKQTVIPTMWRSTRQAIQRSETNKMWPKQLQVPQGKTLEMASGKMDKLPNSHRG